MLKTHTQAFISYEFLWNIPDSRAQEIPGGIPRNLEGSLSANTWTYAGLRIALEFDVQEFRGIE